MRFYYYHANHWDREWHQTFQEFRSYLTDEMEYMLDIFDAQEDYHFTSDGQTSVLLDAVELRPSLKPRLEKVIREGRLDVGPWYVMPDEALVSAESMIRNLLLGRRIARSFGAEPWPVGYCCDIFGHVAQLPQIFAGFQLAGAVVWRGFPEKCGGFVFWKSPDGTVLRAIRLEPDGYVSLGTKVRTFYDVPLKKEEFQENFKKTMAGFGTHWGSGAAVLMDSFDHAFPVKQTGDFIRWITELYPGSTVDRRLVDAFDREFGPEKKLPTLEGEQFDPSREKGKAGEVINGVYSSRYDVKLANDQGRDLLELLLEPECARLASEGAKVPYEKMRYLWKHYLQNHAHDSICGCSIDPVHRQMLARYEEVMALGKNLSQEFRNCDLCKLTGLTFGELSGLSAKYLPETGGKVFETGDGTMKFRIYNPLPCEVDGVRELVLPLPVDYPSRFAEPFGFEPIIAFHLYDEAGQEIVYSVREIARSRTRRFYRGERSTVDYYKIVARVKLAPGAWTTLTLRPSTTPVRHYDTLLTGGLSASNGMLSLEIRRDGSYTLTDLRNGRIYPNQNELRIDREVGDGWFHYTPRCTAMTTASGEAQVRILHDGPERAEFEIIRTYRLPEEMIFEGTIHDGFGGIHESEKLTELKVRTVLQLDAGSDALKVKMSIDNTLKDARVRLMIPTAIAGNAYFVSQSGALLERVAGRQHGKERENWFEAETTTLNFDGLALRRAADGSGFALLAPQGLHHLGMLEEKDSPFELVLYRSFRRTFTRDGESDGQLLKKLEFEFALRSFAPAVTNNELYCDLQKSRTYFPSALYGAAFFQKDLHDGSFLQLEGDLIAAAVKPADDETPGAVIVRLWNLNGKPETGRLVFGRTPKNAALCRLDETGDEPQELSGNALSVTVTPWKMVTVKIVF